jgi:hypothetical protein
VVDGRVIFNSIRHCIGHSPSIHLGAIAPVNVSCESTGTPSKNVKLITYHRTGFFPRL